MFLNMTEKDLTMAEQHIGTVAWIVVITLMTWNVYTTSSLQVSVAELASEVRHMQSQITNLSTDGKRFENRLDSLERRADLCESKQHKDMTL